MIMVMIQIYTDCGKYDKAFDQMDELLSIQSPITTNTFLLDRAFRPLISLPRFKELQARYPVNPGA